MRNEEIWEKLGCNLQVPNNLYVYGDYSTSYGDYIPNYNGKSSPLI